MNETSILLKLDYCMFVCLFVRLFICLFTKGLHEKDRGKKRTCNLDSAWPTIIRLYMLPNYNKSPVL